jgi:hypothetical protein
MHSTRRRSCATRSAVFKGLKRPVIILVELSRNDDKMLARLLDVGGSRARQYLVVIGSSQVLARLR